MDKVLGDSIPEFNRKVETDGAGLSGLSAFAIGGNRTRLEILVIVLVAVVIIGGDEVLLRALNVPQYILPKPSQIVTARKMCSIASNAPRRLTLDGGSQ